MDFKIKHIQNKKIVFFNPSEINISEKKQDVMQKISILDIFFCQNGQFINIFLNHFSYEILITCMSKLNQSILIEMFLDKICIEN